MKYVSVFWAMLLLVVAPAQAMETKASHAVVLDHLTGVMLYDKQAHVPMYPASMTKMMTAYLLFEGLASGHITEDTTYTVSEAAWRKGGSKMFVDLNEQIAVKDLLRGIVIQSGNDACIVVAEGMAGTEEHFAERMTAKAKEIGMLNTNFRNATGWPDEQHVTTAYDLAVLARRTITDFPQYYPIYAELDYTHHGIRQYNRNTLLMKNMGIDGLKTGHTEDAGYGITISGQQNGRRINVVVNGLNSEKERADEAAALYRYAMANFTNIKPAEQGLVIGSLPVWYGATDAVNVTTAPNAVLTMPVSNQNAIKAELIHTGGVKAPIAAGQEIGRLRISAPFMSTQEVPVVAAEDVAEASFSKRLITNITTLLQ